MSDTIETQTIHTGDVRETLPELPASSVHMCMTSPPYFGLRDYGDDEQIGLEESLDEYISELVAVGDALRRVLRDDGSWWLNLGDSYAGSGRGQWDGNDDQPKESYTPENGQLPEQSTGMKRKNKMLVPHRVAIALQEAGWVVRNDVTWLKPNPMPSSVKDRLNTTTEQIFHLTPKPDYWYDLDAIRGDYSESMKRRADAGYKSKHGGHEKDGWGDGSHHQSGGLLDDSQTYEDTMNPAGKNPGDVFEVTTKPFADAHFAVYPPALCEKPIKASCPPQVCADCGAPYEREVERETVYDHKTTEATGLDQDRNDTDGGDGHDVRNGVYSDAEFKGWSQTCDCDIDDTEPGIVLDPFAGAGTTLLKAKELGRRFVGIELNPEYADMARSRVGLDVDDPSRIRDDAQQRGLEGFGE
jgi:DNA modification methylase